jgi:hypothetical protein
MPEITELTLEELSELALNDSPPNKLTLEQLADLTPEQLADLKINNSELLNSNLIDLKGDATDDNSDFPIHADINITVMELLSSKHELLLPNNEPELNIIDMTPDEIKELTMDQINTVSHEQIGKLSFDQMNFLPVLPVSMRVQIASVDPVEFAESLSQFSVEQLMCYPQALAAALLPCQIECLTQEQQYILEPVIHFGSIKLKAMLATKLE